jgi:hypothetical protein
MFFEKIERLREELGGVSVRFRVRQGSSRLPASPPTDRRPRSTARACSGTQQPACWVQARARSSRSHVFTFITRSQSSFPFFHFSARHRWAQFATSNWRKLQDFITYLPFCHSMILRPKPVKPLKVLRSKPPNRSRLVLRFKPANHHSDGFEALNFKPSVPDFEDQTRKISCMPRQVWLTYVNACLTYAKLNAFTFLLDLTDTRFITHVDVCLASTKCHDVASGVEGQPSHRPHLCFFEAANIL